MNKAFLVFPLIIFSLLLAVWSGWIRVGWDLPLAKMSWQHGAIMVNSFLASLIFLERAVTFRNKAVLLLPFVNALSAVAFISGYNMAGQSLLIAGSLGFLVMCLYFVYRYKELYYYVFVAGAACLLTGNIILLKTQLYPAAVTWWMGFLLFTIVAERLELSRFLSLTKRKTGFLLAALASVLITVCWPFHLYGQILFALAIAATAIWLLRYDMAWHSIRIKGQHRYSGILLITGYFWLLITSALMITADRFAFGYDATLHSFFIGFVFSMIFSHAPIILPAVAKLPVKIYRPVLYVWFVFLQLSLIIRVIADIITDPVCRRIGGIANGFTILLFFVTVALIVRKELQKRKASVRKA